MRKQTKLSTNSIELAQERTSLAYNRTELSEQRTQLADNRTELAVSRTAYSTERTELARDRNSLAVIRTYLSSYRVILAKERTLLAIIRTGLALIMFGTGLMRYFGLGVWSIMDGILIIVGLAMLSYASKGYVSAYREKKNLLLMLNEKFPRIEDFDRSQPLQG
jgi:uncharacterized membrane protein YidH (DUF202 family)